MTSCCYHTGMLPLLWYADIWMFSYENKCINHRETISIVQPFQRLLHWFLITIEKVFAQTTA
jgi:hypothetical protein